MKNLAHNWWLVLLGGFIGLAGAAWFARQPAQIQARATYLVRIDDIFGSGRRALPALVQLTREPDVLNTVMRIATSRETVTKAANEIGVVPEQFTVEADRTGNSLVFEITVSGTDPQQLALMANAVGNETALSTREAFKVYELELLDPPVVTTAGLNQILVLAAGAGLGLLVGIGVVLVKK
jgi:capsular polysaccharide biosynthesis protein